MTTAHIPGKTPPAPGKSRLPDPPEHPDDRMTSSKQLAATGNQRHLAHHLGNPDTTIIAGERSVVPRPTRNMAGSHHPDLLVAFDVDPAAYEALAILKYWRFDETGRCHGTRLAGDRLVDGVYEPIDIDELAGGGRKDAAPS